MQSLYRRHPVGTLLVWDTYSESASARGDGPIAPGVVELLLDGQQRITSLYGIIRGRPPRFFDGNAQAFTGLYFNLQDETFEFYAPLKMHGNPLWVDVTDLMHKGIAEYITRLLSDQTLAPDVNLYIGRLNAIVGIKDIEFHIEKITGEDKTIDVVVDIFNLVNSGGTKLSKGDLALAKICASWPEARSEMRTLLQKWHTAGFDFRLEWLLRCTNAIVTGEAFFSALKDVSTSEFKTGLDRAEDAIDALLNLISSRLGLDHDRVLGSRYSFPVLARYLMQRHGHLADHRERDRLLYWYVHTFLWGRYAGSTESVLNQDLHLIGHPEGALDRLITQIRQTRADLRVRPDDFVGWSRGARFYPLLYMLTRAGHAQDLDSGIELSQHLLGKMSGLQVHHIFPKALLYHHNYGKSQVNALANFMFLTQETNLLISDHDPSEYLAEVASRHPGALESNWIPTDPQLWHVSRYQEFLALRRELLAHAANEFLDSLYHGTVAADVIAPTILHPDLVTPEERSVREVNAWVAEHGLPKGEAYFQLTDPTTKNLPATLDLAWPDGIQEGYSQPVALLLEEDEETEHVATSHGYRIFTSPQALQQYVESHILELASTSPR